MMTGTREDWFPTSVWFFDHPDAAAVNVLLRQRIAAEREHDPNGVSGRSNILGWQSRHDLHRRDRFGEFLPFVEACVGEVVALQSWDLSQVTPVLVDFWVVVNGTGASNTVHNHANCYLSGVYYVQTPEGCGDLFFLDPRAAPVMMTLPLTHLVPSAFQRVVYRPRPGRLLLFPSWLYHGVEPNQNGQERIALSFNVAVRWREEPV